jgi:hypothetical protein
MKLTEVISAIAEEQLLLSPMLEMANIASEDTGLPVVIWFGEVGGQHGPRIKASNIKGKFAKNDNFVLDVAKDPKVMTPRSVKLKEHEVQDIKDWIKLNYDELMELWKHFETGEGSTIELLSKLKKLT